MAPDGAKEIKISIPEEIFSFLLPEKTAGHLIQAKKEVLLAFRSLIDARIEALDRMEQKGKEKKKTAQKEKRKIKVE